jgi:hypothetical protein
MNPRRRRHNRQRRKARANRPRFEGIKLKVVEVDHESGIVTLETVP